MLTIIQTIGYGLVLLLCLFSIYILYWCFRGGIGKSEATGKAWLLDRTAWGMNGIALLWIVLRHRDRLFKMVELSDAQYIGHDKSGGTGKMYRDSGEVHALLEGTVVQIYLTDEEGVTLYVRRPFQFLERDWMESMGFRRDDGRVT